MAAPDFWADSPASEDGSVAPVDPSDLKSTWKMQQDVLAQHGSGQHIGISRSVYARACSPGADVMAVWYRATILQLLAEGAGLLPPELPEAVRDAVFRVAAKFPMKRLEVGVEHKGFPVDVQEFVRQVELETTGDSAGNP